MLLAEFLQRKSLPPALHAARRRLKVSETESPSRCDTIGTNRVRFGEPQHTLSPSLLSPHCRPWHHREPLSHAAPTAQDIVHHL
jgi:hypothetical protein